MKKVFIEKKFMEKVIGYMVTFTTYGTWLQGHKRGYVKDGTTFEESKELLKANKEAQTDPRFVLTDKEQKLVRDAFLDEAKVLGQEIYAISVSPTHVHITGGEIDGTIETATARYKIRATKKLRDNGINGKIWTKGFDKRFCLDEGALRARIEYVKRQEKNKERI
jgi:hypothetical protein